MPFRNLILQELDADACERLQLRRTRMPVRFPMQAPQQPITSIYFIESGLGSMTTTLSNGMEVEVGTFAHESAVGISALIGGSYSLNRVFMQIAGDGYVAPLANAQREFKQNKVFAGMVLACVRVHLTQATQSAACNAVHSLEQRLARWLLLCADRTDQQRFSISQEFLGDMLGSSRSAVSLGISALERRGFITHQRKSIYIPDLKALEGAACECFEVVRRQFRREASDASFTL
jgi:CRP-like cAMP-binding protein